MEKIGQRINQTKKFTQEKLGIDFGRYIKLYYHPHCHVNLIRLFNRKELTEEVNETIKNWDKGTRTNKEFFLDIIYSWIVEDYICLLSKDFLMDKLGLDGEKWTLIKSGGDKERKFLLPGKTNPDPDLSLVHLETGEIIGIEIAQDHSGYTKENNTIDLRNRRKKLSKFKDLLKKAKSKEYKGVYTLLVDHKYERLGLIPINEDTKVVGEFYNEKWKKKATRIIANYSENFYDVPFVKIQV